MAAHTETAPLFVKRGDFREASQSDVPDTVACCCVESTRLARVPVIKTLFRKRRPEEKVGVYLSSYLVGQNFPPINVANAVFFLFLGAEPVHLLHWCSPFYVGLSGGHWQHLEVPSHRGKSCNGRRSVLKSKSHTLTQWHTHVHTLTDSLWLPAHCRSACLPHRLVRLPLAVVNAHHPHWVWHWTLHQEVDSGVVQQADWSSLSFHGWLSGYHRLCSWVWNCSCTCMLTCSKTIVTKPTYLHIFVA